MLNDKYSNILLKLDNIHLQLCMKVMNYHNFLRLRKYFYIRLYIYIEEALRIIQTDHTISLVHL